MLTFLIFERTKSPVSFISFIFPQQHGKAQLHRVNLSLLIIFGVCPSCLRTSVHQFYKYACRMNQDTFLRKQQFNFFF